MTGYVNYMERSRDYYAAQGYEKPYRWAHHDTVPFAPLRTPVTSATVAIITTAMPDASFTRRNRRLQVCDTSDPPGALYTKELFWDKAATHTDDLGSYFPLAALTALVADGRLGGIGPHYFCVPTGYSQRKTIDEDAPAVVAQCVKDGVDAAVLAAL